MTTLYCCEEDVSVNTGAQLQAVDGVGRDEYDTSPPE